MTSRSLSRQVRDIQDWIDDYMSGAYPQRTALGPGSVSKTLIKSKSIVASMLDVSELASVATNTGALTVTGDLLAGSGSQRMGYSPADGLYIGNENPLVAPFRVEPTGATTMTSASVTGSVTATSLTANTTGQIAGWTIDSAKLSRGNVGIGDSSGYRIWSGNLTSPALANFSVDNTGSLKALSGTIGPWTLDSAKLALSSGTVGLGQSGSIRLWSGSSSPSSAPWRVDSAGVMTSTAATITGAVTATSGSFTGSVTTANLDANGGTLASLIVDGTLTVRSAVVVETSGAIRSGKTSYGSSTAGWYMDYNGGNPRFDIGNSSEYLRWDGSGLTMKGRFEFGSGDYLDNDILHFDVNSTMAVIIDANNGSSSPHALVRASGSSSTAIMQSGATYNGGTSFGTYYAYSEASASSSGGNYGLNALWNNTHAVAFRINAGSTSATSYVRAFLDDTGGSSYFGVLDANNNLMFGVASNGTLLSGTNEASGGGGSVVRRVPFRYNWNGAAVTGYLYVYNS